MLFTVQFLCPLSAEVVDWLEDWLFHHIHIWLCVMTVCCCRYTWDHQRSISVVGMMHTGVLHLCCEGKKKKEKKTGQSYQADKNLAFFFARALLVFRWLTMNVTKPDCGGTTGTVGDVSGTIKHFKSNCGSFLHERNGFYSSLKIVY